MQILWADPAFSPRALGFGVSGTECSVYLAIGRMDSTTCCSRQLPRGHCGNAFVNFKCKSKYAVQKQGFRIAIRSKPKSNLAVVSGLSHPVGHLAVELLDDQSQTS